MLILKCEDERNNPMEENSKTDSKENNGTDFSKIWYNSPLFVAFITILITLGVNIYMQKSARAWRKNLLKCAFHGEISSIKGVLGQSTKTAYEAFKQGKFLRVYSIEYPRVIFAANAGNLGDLIDPKLVGQISSLYSVLERINENGRRIMEKIYPQDSFYRYSKDLCLAYLMCLSLDLRLTQQTEEYTEKNWCLIVTKEYEQENKFALQFIKAVDEKSNNQTLKNAGEQREK